MFRKRGNFAWDVAVHLIIVLLVFSSVALFVSKQADGSYVYEEIYAKEIGLIIDSSKPGMEVFIDFAKGYEIAEENKKTGKLVSYSDNIVDVSLANRGSYVFEVFTDYEVELIEDRENKKLIIIVGGEK